MSEPGTTSARRPPFDWEGEGFTLGASLEGYHSIVVLGLDPVATSRVALGIGRAVSAHRRVAVGDLFAESPPIQELVTSDDPHGIVDSFLYGVSLNKIAHLVEGTHQLFVMPSGTEAPNYEEIMPHPRWRRLAGGFREVGALLVLAAPVGAPHIVKLVDATDGAILVGDAVPPKLPVSQVIAAVREPKREARPAPSEQVFRYEDRSAPRQRFSMGFGIALTVLLAAAGLWFATRPLDHGRRFADRVRGKPDTTRPPAVLVKPESLARPDTAVPPDTSAQPTGAASALPVVANRADSATAAVFGVALMAANTQAGAILKLQQDGKNLPAATFAPILVQGARWFKVIGGAYADRAQADSLLAALRRRRVLDGGGVVRVPFAFLIDSGVPATAVAGMVSTYADRGQPVYALKQSDGSAWLLAGAFETPEQSALYAESLRASGIVPVLVYRKGRVF